MGKLEKVKRKSGAGAFFGGTFIGFLLGIGLIVGICAFAYFKVSPQWLNKTFKTDIDFGSEEANNKTLSDVVEIVINIANSSDTYTLNSLNEDFGIELPSDLMGINIEDLKTVPLTGLGDAFQNKLSNISAKELEGLFTSEALTNIMSKNSKYYLNSEDGKLYKNFDGTTYSEEAEFEYSIIAGTSIKIKNFEEILLNPDKSVDITLELLPLTVAIDDFAGNLGDNLTLQELKLGYGVDLPNFIFIGNETKTVNQLQEIINSLTVSKLLDVNVEYDEATKKFYNDKNNNSVYDTADEEEISSIVAAIAGSTINGISGRIATLTLAEMFPNRTGFFALIDNPEKVLLTGETSGEYKSLSDAFDDAFKISTLEDLVNAGVLDIENFIDEDGVEDSTVELGEKYVNTRLCQAAGKTGSVKLKTLTLPEFITISLLGLENSGMLTDTAV